MAENNNNATQIVCSLKLYLDKNSHKVLFAEAPKEFVDTIFALLSIPIGSIMGVAGKDVLVGSCLRNVFDSVNDIGIDTNLLPMYQNNKASILTPKSRQFSVAGFVTAGSVTYIVLDNLTVKPMNTLSVIDIANKLHIEDIANVEEIVVDVEESEISKVISASFQSNTVLTDVFLQRGAGN